MTSPADQSALADSETALSITRIYDAPREAVFAAWTDPVQFGTWMGPGTIKCEVEQFDLRPGGAYRLMMRGIPPSGNAVRGVYREIDPPSRLVFTWAWDTDMPNHVGGHESLVTLTLRALGNKTELTLRHEKLESPQSRDGHNGGWLGVFDKLDAFLKQGRA